MWRNCSSLNAEKDSDNVYYKRSQLSCLADIANNYNDLWIRNFMRAQISQDYAIIFLVIPDNQSVFSEEDPHIIILCI